MEPREHEHVVARPEVRRGLRQLGVEDEPRVGRALRSLLGGAGEVLERRLDLTDRTELERGCPVVDRAILAAVEGTVRKLRVESRNAAQREQRAELPDAKDAAGPEIRGGPQAQR
jgi:hypothetical protein